MKKIYLLTCFFWIAYQGVAQNDTIYVSSTESNEPVSPAAFIDARDEVFRMQTPCRYLFKFNLMAVLPRLTGDRSFYPYLYLDNPLDVQGVDVSGEFKLTSSLSIDAGVQAIVRNQGNWFPSTTFRVEPRWYYGMSRKIKKGQQADNLSGNYISLEYAHSRYESNLLGDQNSLLLNWGAQRRIFDWGYFDFGFGAGAVWVSNSPYSRGRRILYARPRAAVGLAMTRRRTGKRADNYCEALRCFVEERSMWKADLLTLIDFYSEYRNKSINLNPKIAYERKIGQSAWSLHTEAGGAFFYGRYVSGFPGANEQRFTSRVYQAAVTLQPRWYFNMKRRIALGKSGNNLSGLYASLQTRWEYSYQPGTNIQISGDRTIQQWSLAPVCGFQQRFMRNGYVDFNIGLGGASRTYIFETEVTDKATVKENLWYLAGGLRVGIAF